MKEELRIDIVGLAGACSYALDCIEAELVKIKNKHGKRVAYISVCMAEYLAIQGDALQDLAICALLHDNALTQYISEEVQKYPDTNIKKVLSENKTNMHEYRLIGFYLEYPYSYYEYLFYQSLFRQLV